MNDTVRRLRLRMIQRAIEQYATETGREWRHWVGHESRPFVPSLVIQFDGRTLRALREAGYIHMSPQDSGSRDPRYLATWANVSLTQRGLALLATQDA